MKIVLTILMCLGVLLHPISVQAHEVLEWHIEYETAIEVSEMEFLVLPYAVLCYNTSIELTYNKITIPEDTYYYEANNDGKKYAGTLYLQEYYYRNSKTIAVYSGTLYFQG